MRRTRKKDTKAIFISSTELLRNTLISFLAETGKNIGRGSLSTDQLLQLTIQFCYVLTFYMFYAKCLCENRPLVRDKSRSNNKFKVVVQFKQIPFKCSDCYMLSGIKLASIYFSYQAHGFSVLKPVTGKLQVTNCNTSVLILP